MHETQIDQRHRENIEHIVALEVGHIKIFERLDHLDECVDGMKVKLAAWEGQIGKWEKRWRALFWLLIGVALASGSGTVSLQHLIEWLKMIT